MMILIHGWCGDRSIWREQMRRARWAGEVFDIDLPGHGIAGIGDVDADASIAAFASWVAAFVNDATRGPVVLVGHSMGGPVALEAAIALGDRCRLLVGVDTFTDARFYASRPDAEVADRLAEFDGDFAGALRAMIERIVGPRCPRELRADIAASMLRMPKARALAALRSLLLYDIEARWPKLRSPAVTINASRLMDPSGALDLPGLVVRRMANVGHFPMLEAPAAFDEILASVVASRGVSRRSWTAIPR